MATRDIRNIKKDYLICAICRDEYTDPRKLPCDHTFCHNCLSEHISKSRPNTRSFTNIKCPSCRELVKLKSPESSNDAIAAFFPHQSLLRDIGELVKLHESGLPPCKHHSDKPAEYFCSTDNVPLCPDCAISKHSNHNCNVIRAKEAYAKLQQECTQIKKTYDDKTEYLKSLFEQEYKKNLSLNIKAKTLMDIEEFQRQLELFYVQALNSIDGLKGRLQSRKILLPKEYENKVYQMIDKVQKRKKQLGDTDKDSELFIKIQNFRKDKESFVANLDKDIEDLSGSVFQRNVNITDLFQRNISAGTLMDKDMTELSMSIPDVEEECMMECEMEMLEIPKMRSDIEEKGYSSFDKTGIYPNLTDHNECMNTSTRNRPYRQNFVSASMTNIK